MACTVANTPTCCKWGMNFLLWLCLFSFENMQVTFCIDQTLLLFVLSSYTDFGQYYYFHVWQHGGGIPQTSDGVGTETDLPGHLQLHKVPY